MLNDPHAGVPLPVGDLEQGETLILEQAAPARAAQITPLNILEASGRDALLELAVGLRVLRPLRLLASLLRIPLPASSRRRWTAAGAR